MYIKKNIFAKLLSACPACPPETGGLLGGQKGTVIQFVLDSGCRTKREDFYIPNTEYLNSVIAQWQAEGVEFLGVFHTHPKGAQMLSRADCAYIETIMQSLPEAVRRLYFPIVIPQTDIIVFCAERRDGQMVIRQEQIVLVK